MLPPLQFFLLAERDSFDRAVRDSDLGELAYLDDLQWLSLRGTSVTDQGLAQIRGHLLGYRPTWGCSSVGRAQHSHC